MMFLKPNELLNQDKNEKYDNNYSSVVFNPYSSLSIQSQREKLPIYKYREVIFDAIENYQTTIVIGETGCGKTTQIPIYLVEWGWTEPKHNHENVKRPKIALIEPRRMATIKTASRLAEEMETTLGSKVGYTIRFDSCYNEKQASIKVMTRGILFKEMLQDPLLTAYDILIFDEAHERNVESDILFGLLKKVLLKRLNFRLIILSATYIEHFKAYFDLQKYLFVEEETAIHEESRSTTRIVNIQTRHYHNDIYYVDEPVDDYIQATCTTVIDILKNSKIGDILAFLPGKDEIERCIKLIDEQIEHLPKTIKNFNPGNMLVLPLYAALPERDQMFALTPSPPHKRKCILATNVAETSLTITGIEYVIDCGFEKLRYFDNRFSLELLGTVPISKSAAIQRAGRAGRTCDGKVFRLYTENAYDEMADSQVPEIQRCDLSQTILNLKAFGVNVITFNYLSPPPSANVISALETLYFMDAIDKSGELTSRGKLLVEFPLPPNLANVVLKGLQYNCLRQTCYIATMLQIRNIYVHSKTKRLLAETKKLCNFAVQEGDLFTYMNIFEAYTFHLKRGKEANFCRENFLNPRGLHRATLIFKQIKKHLTTWKREMIKMLSAGDEKSEQSLKDSFSDLENEPKDPDANDYDVIPNPDTIMKCIIAGFFQNIAQYNSIYGYYETVKNKFGPLRIHPDSVLFSRNPPPKFVIFSDIVFTSSSSSSKGQTDNASTTITPTAYMYDVTALPAKSASQLLCQEMPQYFIFGTGSQRFEQESNQ